MKTLGLLIFILFLTSCSHVEVSRYSDREPELNFFEYFQGNTRGWGIVQDRNGEVTRQFVVDIEGTLNGKSLILHEDFTWNDGEQSQRTWTLKQQGEHNFTGTAEDVIGVASGSAFGNALNWQYTLLISVNGNDWKIHLDDWMFLQPDNILINKTEMSKFGIHLGEITIVFNKQIPGIGEMK